VATVCCASLTLPRDRLFLFPPEAERAPELARVEEAGAESLDLSHFAPFALLRFVFVLLGAPASKCAACSTCSPGEDSVGLESQNRLLSSGSSDAGACFCATADPTSDGGATIAGLMSCRQPQTEVFPSKPAKVVPLWAEGTGPLLATATHPSDIPGFTRDFTCSFWMAAKVED
jgi:hypothetical protein